MKKYNHMYGFCFSVESDHPQGEDLSAAELRTALLTSLARVDDAELMERLGFPDDTYEIEDTIE